MQNSGTSNYETPYYKLTFRYSRSHFILSGVFVNLPLTTHSFPETYNLLQQYVPKIFSCACFSEKNLPFSQELLKTEVSHLLEHILLEFLCEEKLSHGAQKAVFDGLTRWYIDSPQNFEILISKHRSDKKFFLQALKRSLFVFDKIISTPLRG